MKTKAVIHYHSGPDFSVAGTREVPANFKSTCTGCKGTGKVYFGINDTDPIPCTCNDDLADAVVRELIRGGARVDRIEHVEVKEPPRPFKYRYGGHYSNRRYA